MESIYQGQLPKAKCRPRGQKYRRGGYASLPKDSTTPKLALVKVGHLKEAAIAVCVDNAVLPHLYHFVSPQTKWTGHFQKLVEEYYLEVSDEEDNDNQKQGSSTETHYADDEDDDDDIESDEIDGNGSDDNDST